MAKFETEADARALLQQIKQYWAEQGYEIEGQIVPGGYSPRLRSTVYELRTNLVNGLPTNTMKRVA